jgi:hypothetical protein
VFTNWATGMAAPYSIWKRLGHLRIGNVNYDIGVKEREDGRFLVSWVCLACCEQGPPAPAVETVEKAIEVAHVGLRIHHNLTHAAAGTTTTAPESITPQSRKSEAAEFQPASRPLSTFSEAREAFQRLSRANAKRARLARSARSNRGESSYVRNCANWSALAREFNDAIESYGRALEKRSQELELALDKQFPPRGH